MKYQNLFFGENKKNINLSSAALTQRETIPYSTHLPHSALSFFKIAFKMLGKNISPISAHQDQTLNRRNQVLLFTRRLTDRQPT